jgi:hypothetical protein
MHERKDKRRIYYLINMYLSEKVDETTFCNEFYYSYDLELDYRSLTEEEHKAFSELGEVAGRFSEFGEDHKKLPGVYYTKKELRQKTLETKEKLTNIWKT